MLCMLQPTQAFCCLFLCVINVLHLQVTAQVNQSNGTSSPTPSPPSNHSIPVNNSSLPQLAHGNQTQSNHTSTSSNISATPASDSHSTTTRLSSLLNNDEAVPLDTKITVPFSILGALLVASGAPMAFWGGRNRWSSYFLTGAYVAALIVMIPILRFGVIEQDKQPSMAIQGVFVLACLISAFGAGALAVIFWKGTKFIVGGAGGFVISLFILSLKSNSLIPAVGLRWVVILIGISIGFILATVPALTIHVTLFSTAALGSAAVVLGIDCFTTGGLKEFWLYIVGFGALFPKLTYFPFTVTMQAELGVMGGLFLMGAAIQWRLLEIIKKKINELKQMDAERQLQEDAAAYRQSMALDADLALWEKRFGDDEDSMTMTAAASPRPYHLRKSSQFSLLPLASPSPNTKLEGHSEALPSIDGGLGLAGSLGIAEEFSNTQAEREQSNVETLGATPEMGAAQHRQFPSQRMSTQPQSQPTTPSMLSINFEQSDKDRRFSRPPGAPSSWTRPISVSKPASKNSPPVNSRLPPSSPKHTQSRPLSTYPWTPQPAEEVGRGTRSRSTSEHNPRYTLFESPSQPQRPEQTSRVSDSKPRVDPKRHSEGPSRVIVGSYQPPAARSSPAAKRASTILTVEELEQRHRQAIKKIQLPATERVSSSSADAKQSSKDQYHRQSVNLKHQVPNSRSSAHYPPRDRTLSHLSSGRNGPQPGPHAHPHNRASTSSENHPSPLGSSPPPTSYNNTAANVPKSKPTNGWLNY